MIPDTLPDSLDGRHGNSEGGHRVLSGKREEKEPKCFIVASSDILPDTGKI